MSLFGDPSASYPPEDYYGHVHGWWQVLSVQREKVFMLSVLLNSLG